MKRYLITTADERSWVFDRPVLFLGEWCCRYDRQQIWSKMDAIVAPPYGLENKKEDLEYIQTMASQLLLEVSDTLNSFHQTQHSSRYWNIVLGHWLKRYVSVAFNRYQVLTQTLKNYNISGSTILEAQKYTLSTSNSDSFVWATNNDQWNHVFFSKILLEQDGLALHFDPNVLLNISGFNALEKKTRDFNLKNKLKQILRKSCTPFCRNTDPFIIKTYLPPKEEIKLQLSLGQVPQFWQTPDLIPTYADPEIRKNIKLTYKHEKNVEAFVRKHLIEAMPSCYIEGYQALVRVTQNLNWPKAPEFIFTSNNFDTDEIFKIWAASKVNKGVPYYIGQHGNNYGTCIKTNYSPEMSICDRFITWGWKNKTENKIPAFIFKTTKKTKQQFNPNGNLLFIQATILHWLGPNDHYYEFGKFQEEQFKFVETLSQKIRQALIIRLHHNFKRLPWFEDKRWQDRYPDLVIEKGEINIKKLIRKSRLVLHSYDSTGLLECLSLNIPTLAFWHHGFEHLEPSAIPYYQLLKDVNILHDTPEQASCFIMKHWDNLKTWWNAPALQNARTIFCHQYAREEKHPIGVIKSILRNKSHSIK